MMRRLSSIGALLLLATIALGGCQSRPPAPEPRVDVGPTTTGALDRHAYYAMCGGRLTDLEELIGPIAARMTSQQIPYTQDPAQRVAGLLGQFPSPVQLSGRSVS